MCPSEATPSLDGPVDAPSHPLPVDVAVDANRAVDGPDGTTCTGDQRLDETHSLIRQGELTEALSRLTQLHDSGAIAPTHAAYVVLLSQITECRLARGDVADALALSHELDPFLGEPGTRGAFAHFARSELATAVGEPDRAVEHLGVVAQLLAEPGENTQLVPWRAAAALAAVRAGLRREAVAFAREHLDLAQGEPYETAQGLRALAAADAQLDRIDTLRAARAALAPIEARRLAAQIDTDLAGLLLLHPGAEAEALLLLRSAEEYAGHQELWPLRSRVRRLLDRMNEPPTRARTEALALLTKSEQRVALLAASGLTNRQIAQELTVTVKAIEWHLSHVYRKLDVRRRAGLAPLIAPADQPD